MTIKTEKLQPFDENFSLKSSKSPNYDSDNQRIWW